MKFECTTIANSQLCLKFCRECNHAVHQTSNLKGTSFLVLSHRMEHYSMRSWIIVTVISNFYHLECISIRHHRAFMTACNLCPNTEVRCQRSGVRKHNSIHKNEVGRTRAAWSRAQVLCSKDLKRICYPWTLNTCCQLGGDNLQSSASMHSIPCPFTGEAEHLSKSSNPGRVSSLCPVWRGLWLGPRSEIISISRENSREVIIYCNLIA